MTRQVSGKGLAKKWVELFTITRERFQTEIASIPIANKAYRLRALDRMAAATENKNFGMTAQLMEQAAKEVGDAYTNRQKVEHSGGVAISSVASVMDEIGDDDL